MYEINGTALRLPPMRGRWVPRNVVGTDGNNKKVYDPTYSYQLEWGPMSMHQYQQLCEEWEKISVTGTASIILPQVCQGVWTGTTYTNVVFDEPETGYYWEQHALRPKLLVRNIRR